MKKRILTAAFLAAAVFGMASCGNRPERSAEEKTVLAEEGNAVAERQAGGVHKLTMEEFSEKVMDLRSGEPKFVCKRPCVIDFYATWCGPCRNMAPILEELSAEYAGEVDFYKVDVDEESELAGMLGIQSIPMFTFISADGKVAGKTGQTSKSEFETLLRKHCLGK